MKNFSKELILLIILVVPYVYLAMAWDELPQTVPTHFDLSGKPNDWSDKSALLILPGAMSLLVYGLMYFAPRLDPKRKIKQMGDKYYTLRLIMTTFISALMVYVLIISKEGMMKNPGTLLALLGGFFAVMGNYFQTLRPNYFIGIRTPWTLENETVWKKTHTLSGRVWMVGGLLIIITALVIHTSTGQFIAFASLMSLMVIIPVVYSYIVYRREKKLMEMH